MSVNVTIQIQDSGSAFDDNPHEEVARILKDLANSIRQGVERTKLYDINGNVCGKVNMRIEND